MLQFRDDKASRNGPVAPLQRILLGSPCRQAGVAEARNKQPLTAPFLMVSRQHIVSIHGRKAQTITRPGLRNTFIRCR